MNVLKTETSFWRWFFCGFCGENRPGFTIYFDIIYFPLFITIAIVGTIYIKKDLSDIASGMMLPLCGALFGVTFAWSGNITALLSTKEISKISNHVNGGIENYVYSAQSIVLIVLITTLSWAIAYLDIINNFIFEFILYLLTMMCIRECWNLILLAQYLTIARKKVSDMDES